MFVYILECQDGTYYTGIAKDIARRMIDHGKGSRYTRAKKPKALLYVEVSEQAHKREAEIKKFSRKQKEELILSAANQIALYNVAVS